MEFNAEKVRRFLVSTPHGEGRTPLFMPIATRGAVKGITSEEMEEIGAEILLSNTYHLWLNPGLSILKKAKGLHNFINWKKPILTDSGGFQVFSLGKFRKITDQGIFFSDPRSGEKHYLTPQKAIQIQTILGSDIMMVLDECPPWPSSPEDVSKAVQRTTEWAKKCKKHYLNLRKKVGGKKAKPLLFGIVQGGTFPDLREKSAKELVEIGFDGYAIGGVAVGEPRKYLSKVLRVVLPLLPADKPRYLMGLGKPEEIIMAVSLGVDMFDCVIPAREGRHGKLFVRAEKYFWLGKKKRFSFSPSEIYRTINIDNEKYKDDFGPVDPHCSCYLCQNHSRAYLRHLFKTKDALGMRLSAMHNLKFYLEMMERMREEKFDG